MGENDVHRLYQLLDQLQKSMDEVKKELADTKVLIVGTYVTRADFIKCQECAEERIVKLHEKIEEHEREERANRFKFAGLVATATGIVVSVIQWVVGLYRGGGQ